MADPSPHSQDGPSRGHGSAAESPLARGSDHRDHGSRLLDLVDFLRPAAGVALLLVGRAAFRSLLAAPDGLRGVPWGAFLGGDSSIPRWSLHTGGPPAPAPHLRSGHSAHREGVPAMLPSAGNAAPIRGRREVRESRGSRAVHPDTQGRVHPAFDAGPFPARHLRPGTGALLLMARRPSAAYPARWRYPRRGLPRLVDGAPLLS